jgi:2-(3-amino-3-carboxypropyl)histidine synthase
MTLQLDVSAAEAILAREKPRRVVLNAPDGLMPLTRRFAREMEARNPQLETILIADPTYGSCDTVDGDAQRLNADLAFHVGHNITLPKLGRLTYTIDVWDDIPFDTVASEAAKVFRSRGFGTIGLVSFAQYLRSLEPVSAILRKAGLETLIGKGAGQLHDGQVFGCEFYPAFNIREKVDAMAMLGQSSFHALGVCLSTGKPTFMLDPHLGEVTDVQPLADERLKRAILSIYKARDANSFGVVICLKEGQMMPEQSMKLKRRLESFGKRAELIALREVTPDRINSIGGLDAFVQTGCPRISTDGYTFSKPVLSVPQTEALFKVLSGETLERDFLERHHWL